MKFRLIFFKNFDLKEEMLILKCTGKVPLGIESVCVYQYL